MNRTTILQPITVQPLQLQLEQRPATAPAVRLGVEEKNQLQPPTLSLKTATFYGEEPTFYGEKPTFYGAKPTFYGESKSWKPLLQKALDHLQKS